MITGHTWPFDTVDGDGGKENKHRGASLDSFLRQEGILEEVEKVALERSNRKDGCLYPPAHYGKITPAKARRDVRSVREKLAHVGMYTPVQSMNKDKPPESVSETYRLGFGGRLTRLALLVQEMQDSELPPQSSYHKARLDYIVEVAKGMSDKIKSEGPVVKTKFRVGQSVGYGEVVGDVVEIIITPDENHTSIQYVLRICRLVDGGGSFDTKPIYESSLKGLTFTDD